MAEFNEDNLVYNVSDVPLKFGDDGPKVGIVSVKMNADGEMLIEGVVNDTDVLPQIGMVNIPEFSVYIQSDLPSPEFEEESETEPLMEAFWFETSDDKPFSDVEGS